MNKQKAIVMKPDDNVATAVENLPAGSQLTLTVNGVDLAVTLNDNIPFGHKLAIKPIAKDERIIKYGETIGTATCDIAVGEHTHVHNLVGCRGRGDLNSK